METSNWRLWRIIMSRDGWQVILLCVETSLKRKAFPSIHQEAPLEESKPINNGQGQEHPQNWGPLAHSDLWTQPPVGLSTTALLSCECGVWNSQFYCTSGTHKHMGQRVGEMSLSLWHPGHFWNECYGSWSEQPVWRMSLYLWILYTT